MHNTLTTLYLIWEILDNCSSSLVYSILVEIRGHITEFTETLTNTVIGAKKRYGIGSRVEKRFPGLDTFFRSFFE